MEFKLSSHAQHVLHERQIAEEWLQRALREPDWEEGSDDGNRHYFKSISAHGGRFLHAVVNPGTVPPTIVTVFFDRRVRRKK